MKEIKLPVLFFGLFRTRVYFQKKGKGKTFPHILFCFSDSRNSVYKYR